MKLHITTKYTQRIRNGLLALLFIATQVITTLSVIPKVYAAGVDFDQWANSTPASWQNGNLNANNSAYKEGESVPFRAIITGLSTGEHTLDIEYDNVDSGKHAYDYLTSFDRSYTPDPCAGIAITCNAGTAAVVPVDPTLPNDIQQASGQIKIFGNSANISSVAYLNAPGHDVASAKKTSMRITFTTNDPTAVIAWGGHIAKESDWGTGMGASAISGSPYHQSILALDGSGGNQDRSLKASAVILLPRITITKVVQNGNAQASDFSFNISPAINGQNLFNIPNSQNSVTIFDVVPNGDYTITENTYSGYGFASGTGTNCVFAGATATASVAEGTAGAVKSASCIFTNTQLLGSITIVKDAVPNNSQDFTFTTSGSSLSPFSLDDDGTNSPLSNTKIFNNLLAGTYTITEAPTTGWDLFSISCESAPGVTIDGATTTINLAAGQNVTCKYTNKQRGSITVTKVTNPANDQTPFSITASGNNIAGSATRTLTTTQSVTYDVSQGSYSITEDLSNTPGWKLTDNGCSSITVNTSSLNPSCTITNTKLAKLTIIKDAINNDLQDFEFTTTNLGGNFYLDDDSDVTGASNTYKKDKEFSNLTPGQTYSVTETEQAGWKLSNLSCTGSATYDIQTRTVTFTPSAGQTSTCTFTNTKLGSISGTKYEANADRSIVGTSGLSGWDINLLLNGSVIATTTTNESGDYTFDNLMPDDYDVNEVLQSGWTNIYDPLGFTLNAGEDKTNIDLKNFQNGTISGYKWNDVNGNGLYDNTEPKLGNWTIYIDADNSGTLNAGDPSTTTDTQGAYSFSNLAPNITAGTQYKVCEVQQTGWAQTYPANDACHTAIIDMSGETETRNFGNQGRGTIQVIKNVDTDGDGTIDVSGATDWTWDINGSGDYAAGSIQEVVAGAYTISEDQKANYHVTYSSCSGEPNSIINTSLSVTVTPGENVVCTFVNTRDTGTIKLVKHVINDNGGTANANNFNLHIKQNGTDITGSPLAGSEQGTDYNLETGTYVVSEEQPVAGYTQTSIICAGQPTDTIILASNAEVNCTITNDDIAPQLTVIKQVINDNSGTSAPADFTMQVTGTNVAPSASFPGNSNGKTVTVNAGSYSLSESGPTGYTASYSTDCSGTIALAETKTCTIINDDIPHPGIRVEKTGPTTAHESDVVTYTFTVTNTGDIALANVVVNDDLAGNAAYQSGDTNNDGKLDRTETWIFAKNYTIPSPQVANVVNTATVCATDPADTKVCDDDNHELDVLHPAISITKSGPAIAYEGQEIGYTFLVKNTGDVVLNNVGINDDIATSELCPKTTLAPDEEMTCSAIYIIPISTLNDVTNNVTASGTDTLGQAVTGTDSHTLDVLHPAITVVKSGPTTAYEGDVVTYTFTVTNTGDIALANVVVNDDLAGIAAYQSGDANDNDLLDLLEEWTFTVSYTVPSPQIADVTNNVTASGTDTLGQAVTGTDSHTLDVLHPAITVVKQVISTPEDDGLFNLHIDSTIHASNVSNKGSTGSVAVAPGSHTIGETAGTNTDLSDYAISYSDNCANGLVTVTGDDHQVCTITNTKLAKLTVVKDANPSGDQSFEFTVRPIDSEYASLASALSEVISAPTDNTFALDDNTDETLSDRKTINQLELGSYAITEEPVDGWDLTDITCDQDSIFERDGSTAIVRLTAGSDITCTFTNTQRGNITILKDAQPDSSQVFKFTANVNEEPEAFSLVDDGQDPALATRQFSDLRPGVYEFSEEAIEGWSLSDISCSNSNQDDVRTTANSVSVNLQPGDNIICTFTNTRDTGTITVTKKLTPATDTGKFNLLINGTVYAANIGNGGATDAVTVPTGVHTVSESAGLGTILEGYETTYVCMDNDSIITSGTGTTITALALAKGQNITCTFTNNIGEVLSVVTPPASAPELADTGSAIILALAAGTLLVTTTGVLALATRRYADQ